MIEHLDSLTWTLSKQVITTQYSDEFN